MATPQETLQLMIDEAPTKSADTAKTISDIEAMITDLQIKKNAVKQGVGDIAATRLETYLQNLYPSTSYHQRKGSTYNLIEDANGTLTDWKIYRLLSLTNLTYKTTTQFTCGGNQTSLFTPNADVGFSLESTIVYSTVSSSLYSSTDNITTVNIANGILNSTLSKVWKFHMTYTPGDTTIDNIIGQWDFAHDYVVAPLGLTTGTYGLQDNINKLTDAKNMLALNKSKFDNTESAFGSYV